MHTRFELDEQSETKVDESEERTDREGESDASLHRRDRIESHSPLSVRSIDGCLPSPTPPRSDFSPPLIAPLTLNSVVKSQLHYSSPLLSPVGFGFTCDHSAGLRH